MKYLHDDALAELTALLTECPVWSNETRSNSRTLHGRLEAYTMKRAGTDKKYAVLLGNRYTAEQEAVEEDMAVNNTQLLQLELRNKTNKGGRKRSMSTGEAPQESSSFKHLKTTAIAAKISTAGATTKRGRSSSLDLPLQRSVSAPGTGTTDSSASASSNYFKALSRAASDNSSATTTVNRRLLTDLILTLNLSFPDDYDFCAATAADFTVCSLQTAVTRINERLSELAVAKTTQEYNHGSSGSSGSSFLSNLWTAVDKVITLSQVTAVYSYQPSAESDDPFSFLKQTLAKGTDEDSDGTGLDITTDQHDGFLLDDPDAMLMEQQPASEGEVLWTFNYFFVNKQAKRILLFTCIETMMRACSYSSTSTTAEATNNSTIPEHEAVHHDYGTSLSSQLLNNGSNNSSAKQYHRRWPSSARSSNSDSDNGGDDDDDDTSAAASSVVSVGDFDLDPANAVSGGIPIGTA